MISRQYVISLFSCAEQKFRKRFPKESKHVYGDLQLWAVKLERHYEH